MGQGESLESGQNTRWSLEEPVLPRGLKLPILSERGSRALPPLAERVKTPPLEGRSKPHNSLAKVRVTAMLRPSRVNQMSLSSEVHGNTIK